MNMKWGTNELTYTGATNAITSFIRSGDYSLHEGGDAEFLLKVRRFIPDFKVLAGNAKVTLFFSDYPANTAASANTLTIYYWSIYNYNFY
jgi:hypothetical protein